MGTAVLVTGAGGFIGSHLCDTLLQQQGIDLVVALDAERTGFSPHNLEGSITVLGETGSVKIGGVAVNKVETWQFAEYDDDDREVEQVDYTPHDVYGTGHLGYY